MKKGIFFADLGWCALLMGLSGIASPTSAAEIVTCHYLKTKDEHRCILKSKPEEPVRMGDEVVAYQNEIYWAGTGQVIKVKGVFAVVSFKSAARNLTKGLRAEVYTPSAANQLDWAAAFSRDKTVND